MSTNEIVGAVVFALATILGLFFAVRRYEKDNKAEIMNYIKEVNATSNTQFEQYRKATEENTKQLAIFNNNFEHMLKADNKRDDKIKEHDVILDNHEKRLIVIENKKFKKEYIKQ